MGGIKSRISGRIPEALRARLDRIHATNRTDDSDFIRDAMSALADYVERTGHYRAPLRIEFDEEAAALHLVAEEQAKYESKPAGSKLSTEELKHLAKEAKGKVQKKFPVQ